MNLKDIKDFSFQELLEIALISQDSQKIAASLELITSRYGGKGLEAYARCILRLREDPKVEIKSLVGSCNPLFWDKASSETLMKRIREENPQERDLALLMILCDKEE
jgi:hypothetical protein